jgi:hypothetical protein
MKTRVKRLILLLGLLGVMALVLVALFPGTHNPVALLRVVDATGKPIAGAIVRPEGLRTKPGPYSGGWYSWQPRQMGVPNDPVMTDADGRARLPYPKYVFERIETGTICLGVEHADFVPDRPERMVNLAPPSRAPWRAWVDYIWGRVRHKALVVRPDPIVLKLGGVLRLKVRSDLTPEGIIFAQVGGVYDPDNRFWIRPAPNELVTKRLQPGTAKVRAVQFDTNGTAWFGPMTNITAVAGQTKEIEVKLTRGVSVRGQLDQAVVRPIRNGKVIAHVWPEGEKPANNPPEWHAWSSIREDGTFEIGSLPEGKLELVALCDGYVSTNGPGTTGFHYPQVHTLGTNDLDVTLGMERSCSLAVSVTDEQGTPIKDAQVMLWPNIRYGEWSATIFGADNYNTADFIRDPGKRESLTAWWRSRPASFTATSDVTGLALVMNLPREAKEFAVTHSNFALPARDDGYGRKERQMSVALSSGQTNRVAVQLQPVERAPIAHY